jgi:hypothetical protein
MATGDQAIYPLFPLGANEACLQAPFALNGKKVLAPGAGYSPRPFSQSERGRKSEKSTVRSSRVT